MAGNTILYRGSLKSCNYHCSYCPFSKHKESMRELQTDRQQWIRFCRSLAERAAVLDIRALLVAPYGEALIHSWYWRGFAELTRLQRTDAVGAQTNLSFPVASSMEYFRQAGGCGDKLRLWASFHPEMVSVSRFAKQCGRMLDEGVRLCAGAVANPKYLEVCRQIRKALPAEVYLWLNRMDGQKRPYTEEEQRAFEEIDPFFFRDLSYPQADCKQCEKRLFVEGDGTLRTCNLGMRQKRNWYELASDFPKPECRRKFCSCYLAYAGREDFGRAGDFGEYPLFRMLK